METYVCTCTSELYGNSSYLPHSFVYERKQDTESLSDLYYIREPFMEGKSSMKAFCCPNSSSYSLLFSIFMSQDPLPVVMKLSLKVRKKNKVFFQNNNKEAGITSQESIVFI